MKLKGKGLISFSLIIFLSTCLSAFAQCSDRPLGETEDALVKAISSRLLKTGIMGTAFVGPTANGARMYMTIGGGQTFAIYTTSGMVHQIQTTMLKDNNVDLDRMMTLVSFIVARFSAENEQTIKQAAYKLYQAAKGRKPQVGFWGDNVIVAEFVDGSPVLSVGKRICE